MNAKDATLSTDPPLSKLIARVREGTFRVDTSGSGTLPAQDDSLSFALNSLGFVQSGQTSPNTNDNDGGGGSSPSILIRNVKQCIAFVYRWKNSRSTDGRRMTTGASDAGRMSQRGNPKLSIATGIGSVNRRCLSKSSKSAAGSMRKGDNRYRPNIPSRVLAN